LLFVRSFVSSSIVAFLTHLFFVSSFLTPLRELRKVREQVQEDKRRAERALMNHVTKDGDHTREKIDKLTEMVAAMTPQKKKSVPTEVSVATAASSVPSIHHRPSKDDNSWIKN
jgi:hypothetical protein